MRVTIPGKPGILKSVDGLKSMLNAKYLFHLYLSCMSGYWLKHMDMNLTKMGGGRKGLGAL